MNSSACAHLWRGTLCRVVLLLLCLGWRGVASAQSPTPANFHVRSWRVGDGLPDNSVRSITQTTDGRLWIATDGGVVESDGLTFTVLPKPVQQRLAKLRVDLILGGRNGGLWLGTRLGGLFSWADGRLTPGSAEDPEQSRTPLTALSEDSVGNVWIGRRGLVERYHHGVREVTAITGQSVPEPNVSLMPLAGGDRVWVVCGGRAGWCGMKDLPLSGLYSGGLPVIPLASVDSNHLWIGRDGMLEKLETISGAVSPFGALPTHTGNITASCSDGAGGLWLGSFTTGLHHWDGRATRHIDGVPGAVRCLWRDHEGAVWVGTDGNGLHCVRARVTITYPLPLADGPTQVVSVAEDEQGSLSMVALGLRLYRATGGALALIPTPGMAQGQEFRCVLPEPAGGWWLGSIGGGIVRQEKNSSAWHRADDALATRRVRCLFRDGSGTLWTGLDDGLAWWNGDRFINALQGGQHRIMCFAAGPQDRLWFGTMGGRVIAVEGLPPRQVDEVEGLPGSMVHALCATPDGALWMGLEGVGLFRRTPDGRVTSVNVNHGLPGNSVLTLVAAGNGLLAMGTQRGICLARISDIAACADGLTSHFNVAVVGAGEGLDDVACSLGGQPTAWMRQSGTIAFATSAGVVEFDPKKVTRTPPRCRLSPTALESDGRSQPVTGLLLESQSGARSTQLHVLAATFRSPSLLRLRYRVQGHDDDWHRVTGSRVLPLGTPSPGQYIVRVQASNNGFDWEEPGMILSWHVHPQIWQTRWFQALAIGIAGVFAFVF